MRQTLDRSLEQRKVLARITAARLEAILEQNLRYLANFGGPDLNLAPSTGAPTAPINCE